MNPADVKPWFCVGDEIVCAFGEGTIEDIRLNDAMYIVQLRNWKLATGKSPIIYMQESSFWKPNKDKATNSTQETSTPKKESYTEDCIAAASKCKGDATDLFKKGDFEAAKTKYLEALRALQVTYIKYRVQNTIVLLKSLSVVKQYLEDDLTNEQKARVFEQVQLKFNTLNNSHDTNICLLLINMLLSSDRPLPQQHRHLQYATEELRRVRYVRQECKQAVWIIGMIANTL
jgi:hypothetical protein